VSGLNVLRLLLFCVLLLRVQPAAYCQETEEELKLTADKLFETEQYVDATSLYLRLLALNPRSHDYNFRYGTCLLYNSYKKQDAFKYLNYSISNPAIDVRAYYFLGKAYHLNYQFNEAIKNFELYKQKAGAKIKLSLELDRQIEMCQNGKRLLTTITDLVVLEKREIEIARFYDLYNLNNIGGDLLVTADYQSKIDKKKGHVPLIHFPANSSMLFYASYGETDTGNKDIYMRRKLPDGSWGLPQAVQGNVNTSYDEDFPYMHPGGEYLYFCSKGHNSMGGYDIFRSKLNAESSSFGPPENMDFAISSPDNDLFYIVDSLDKNAYFASSRQSSNGKMFVYKVRVDRVPLQLAVVKGNFASSINPENKKLSIVVTDYSSGEKIGTFSTNEKGSYLITLPKGGKYTYEMKVEGKSDVHKYLVTIPFSKEFRPLKQKILEETVESAEVVRVIDLFNEEVDDPVGILAEVIKLRSELNPNASQYNLDALDAGKENQKILAELGFENAGPQEIAAKFERLEDKQQDYVQTGMNLVNGGLTVALEKLADAEKLQEKAKTLVNKGTGAETKEAKFESFTQAQEAINKATELKKQARMLLAFSDSVAKTLPMEEELLAAIEAITKEVKVAVADGNAGDLKDIISENSSTITAVSAIKEPNPVDVLIEQKSQLKKEQSTTQSQKDNYAKTAAALEKEIKELTAGLPAAKKKDQPAMQSAIDSKTQELSMVNEENDRLTKKLIAQKEQENAVDQKIAFLQDVTQVDGGRRIAPNEVQTKLTEVDTKNSNTLAAYINQQVTELKKDPSLVASKDPVEATEKLENDHATALNAINERAELTPEEKTQLLLAAETDFVGQLDEAIADANVDLQKNPESQQAIDRKKELDALKSKTEARLEERKKEIAAQADPTDEQPTAETELLALSPNYAEAISTTSSDPKATLQARNTVDENLLAKVGAELVKVDAVLAAAPTDKKAQERKTALTQLKTRTEEQVSAREKEIAALGSTPVAAVATPESELEALEPGYTEAISAAASGDPKTTLEAQNAIDEQLIAKIDAELEKVTIVLASAPEDTKARERKDALTALKIRTEEQVEDRKAEIREPDETPALTLISPESELKTIAPDYETELAAVDGSDRKTLLEGSNAVDNRLVTAIDSELEEVESQLGRNPGNTEAQERKAALDELKEQTTARIAERTAELATITSAETPVKSALTVVAESVRPQYEANRKSIEAKTEPGAERETALLKEDKALLAAIGEAIEKKDAQVLKNPENTGLQDQLDELRTAQSVQEAAVSERELDLIASEQAKIVPETLQAKLAPSYRAPDLENPEHYSEQEKNSLVAAEQQLQEALIKRQNANQKQLKKTEDPKLAAENKVIASLIEASAERIQILTVPVVTAPNAIALIENDLGDEADVLLNSDPETVEQAKRIITELKEYEGQLSEQLNVLKSDDPVNDEEIKQKESQLAYIRKRIGIVEADLDAMENYTIASDPVINREHELARLSGEERALEERIASGNLPVAEKRAAEKELKIVREQKAEGEQLVLTEKITEAHTAVSAIQATIAAEPGTPLTAAVQQRSNDLSGAPANTKAAPTALNTQLQKETAALSLLSAAEGFAATVNTYKSTGVVVETIPALNERKRRFSIEIGQLESEIMAAEKDPAQAGSIAALRQQQSALKAAVQSIDVMIAAVEQEQPQQNTLKKGLETAVTYEDEIAIAGTPDYARLVRENEAVKSTQRQLNEINREKESIRKVLSTTADAEKKASLTEALIGLDSEAKILQQELSRQQSALETSIAKSNQDPEKVKNLLARDVAPVAPVNLASVVAPALNTGFELVANPRAIRTELAIPVDLKMPTGLVYRVQVGAFAKPIREDLFKEFTPVTGEKLNNGITRYLAGYFGNRQRVSQAQKDIRALGYSDAFAVAYCDGERISLAEARRLEEAGLCVPKTQDSLLMEVVESRIAQLSPDSLARLRPVVKKSDYNKAPGAVTAEAVEERQGLFFTVQIGVYNRPATAEQLRNIDPLITKRLDNGQIRYSSGIFQTVAAAKPKRIEAVTRGISDAFVTAYYKGERISLAEASQLLAEQGDGILEQAEITKLSPALFEEAREYTAAQPLKTSADRQPVQIVSTRHYDFYPAEQLNRFNTYGSFYYDAADKRIKSIRYASVDALPQLTFLQESVDTLFQESEIGSTFEPKLPTIVAVWDNPDMSGALANWLLRLTIPHQGGMEQGGYRIAFDEVPAEKKDALMQQLREYGAVSVATLPE